MSFGLKNLCFPILPRQHVQVKNPYLDTMEEDILYHFSLGTKTHNLPEMFGDIKVSNTLDFRRHKTGIFGSKATQFTILIFFSNSLCVWVAAPTE